MLDAKAKGEPIDEDALFDFEQEFLGNYNAIGIDIDRSKLDQGVNEGMRYIAKLFNNSLWGKKCFKKIIIHKKFLVQNFF